MLDEEPPAAPAGRGPRVAPARPRRRLPLRPSSKSGITIGGIAALLLVCGSIGLRVCRVSRAVFGQTVENQVVSIDPEGDYGGTLEVSGSHSYTFTVTAMDGPVLMGLTRVSGKGPPAEPELMALVTSSQEVAKGASNTMTGRMNSGHYLWAVLNASKTAKVRAKISINAH